MSRPFILSLLLTSPAFAEFAVRVVTVSVPELPAIRASMLCSPGSEGDLRRELLPFFAEPVSDMLLRCSEGRVQQEVLVETPYPTEFTPPDEHCDSALPDAFAFKNAGCSAEVTVQAGPSGRGHVVTVAWQKVVHDGDNVFPLPAHPASAPLTQPRFAYDSIIGRLAVTSGRWRLLGMVRPNQSATAQGTAARTLLTFIQVVDSKAPANGAHSAPPESRLHFLTFRIPAAEGMTLASRTAGSDSDLLDRLLERAERGELILDNHAACVLEPLPPHPSMPGPSSKDPFASPPTGAKVASFLEFPYATRYAPNPGAFSAKNTGSSIRFTNHSLEWDVVNIPPRMVPRSPQAEAAGITDPEFTTEALSLVADLPPGAARLAALTLLFRTTAVPA